MKRSRKMTKTKMITVNQKTLEKLGKNIAEELASLQLITMACDSCDLLNRNNKSSAGAFQTRMTMSAVRDQADVIHTRLDKIAHQLLNCEEELLLKNK